MSSKRRSYESKKRYNAEWNKANPDARTNTNLKLKYGITLEDYNRKLESQNGVCAICEKPETVISGKSKKVRRLTVDHCHKTKKVRDLLCATCNFAIGSLRDDPILAEKVAVYLRKHSQ